MPRSLLAVPVLAVLVSACAGPIADLSATPVGVDEAAAARAISAYRARHGLGPVTVDPALSRAARAQALAMASADKVSHTVAGRLPGRVTAAGYDWATIAENLGGGYDDAGAALAGWIASPGHDKNLRSAPATEIGIGAADAGGSRYGRYFALILASPRPPREP